MALASPDVAELKDPRETSGTELLDSGAEVVALDTGGVYGALVAPATDAGRV